MIQNVFPKQGFSQYLQNGYWSVNQLFPRKIQASMDSKLHLFNSQTSSMITIGNPKKYYIDIKEQLSDDQA